MVTMRDHLNLILNPPLMHEDETIDFMLGHAAAALEELNKSDGAYGNEKRSPHPYWRLVWDADGIAPGDEATP